MRARVAAYALIVVGALSAVSWLGLFFYYSETRPHHPEPENGRVIALNNHGQLSYLTGEEDRWMTLLSFGAAFMAIGGAILATVRVAKN